MTEVRNYISNRSNLIAIVLSALVVAYIGWKVAESPDQALQFAFNGMSVGAVYALVALGFTIVYSTVWFFDMYYGAAAALGAYGVFYLRSSETLGGLYEVNNPIVNGIFALVVAGVVFWALHTGLYYWLRARFSDNVLRVGFGAVALIAGAYIDIILTRPEELHVTASPAIAISVAVGIVLLGRYAYTRFASSAISPAFTIALAVVGIAVGAALAAWIAETPGSKLYLSWGVSCLLAGTVSLALYRGLYVYMRQRARSPLVMLVATLGILLAFSALIVMVFEPTPRPLPETFGNEPWNIGGATIKGFNLFTIGVAIVGFLALLWLLKMTTFGRTVRAIGDDEEVAKVVGINTTVIIAIVFFIGAVFAALGGLLSGHDTAIQPRMGLLLLLKGWIASVVGGIGNIYGAILGGFILGMLEQFGIWDLAGEWRDVVSFVVLILFLSFWPTGILPRK
ncbi:MAG: branched-chain amino acid ABC transporter permease [Chloroflexi bacterium]|nr:branched-chain amino acid ABC transporter permease [Chloroflexota bacterium]